jgi:hypothetical protein
MAWTTPRTWVDGEVPGGSTFNAHVRDNLLYLLARPNQRISRDAGSSYTTTSTSFVDIDGTNLSISLTTSGSAVLIGMAGAVRGDSTDVRACFDVTIDGTRYAATTTEGITQGLPPVGGNFKSPISFAVLATGLSVGSHTFRLQWKVQAAGTTALLSGGVANNDHPISFWAVEVA